MDISQIFWNASVDEIKRGYIYNEETEKYICLICGKEFIKGVIYREGEFLLDAERGVKNHISREHGSVFDYLINMDKKLTGLTEHQKNLLSYFYKGLSDSEIVKKLDGGSTSTVRNHRFSLRQREKQAKIFLAIMELLESKKSNEREDFVEMHRTAKMVDERYAITQEEKDEVLKNYFKEGLNGPLSEFPKKEKRKLIILRHLIERFDVNKKYTEKEVNKILEDAYYDYVTLRRYLIEYGFMDRIKDGSLYWVKM